MNPFEIMVEEDFPPEGYTEYEFVIKGYVLVPDKYIKEVDIEGCTTGFIDETNGDRFALIFGIEKEGEKEWEESANEAEIKEKWDIELIEYDEAYFKEC